MKFPFIPEQASTFAGQYDTLYWTLVSLSIAIAGVLPFIILYLVVKYHRSMTADRSNPVNSNLKLELTWSIIPFIITMGIFVWSATLYFNVMTPPKQTLDIYVIGKQWMWQTRHTNGRRENNELHVPVGIPVRLIMTSQDVIHSFYVPAFRIKQDVVPGRFTTFWFEATKTGDYQLFCTEYCGTDHASMIGRVIVMPLPDYQQWLATVDPVILQSAAGGGQTTTTVAAAAASPVEMAAAGAQLFQKKGCFACHRADGKGVGPALNGVFGKSIELVDGTKLVVDENYLRNSILNPASQVLQGYTPVMPTFEGQLSIEELLQLIEYVKTLK